MVPQSYDDLELADLVVLVGSNAAWCHPILYQRIQIARAERGMRVVNIDPRRTATSEGVDLHLSIRPGTDSQLWNGLLVWMVDRGLSDDNYIKNHTEGFADALALARETSRSVEMVAAATGLDAADIEQLYQWWSETPRVVSCYSQGVNQSAQGTDKVNAIINCHLATGRVGKAGSGPLSFTGQPNAMGGREVGGLANMLAAHMGFSATERDRVGRFWKAPNVVASEGMKAVDMFDAIEQGRIKALWVMGTNPAVSLPRADHVRRALAKLEVFVVSENVASNDTLNCASIRLPAAAWGEKDGTVTNSERCISRQRQFMALAGEARPDWWIMGEVARRLGWADAFAYDCPAGIFREHAQLSGFENNGERAFNISGLGALSDAAYDELAPIQWPVLVWGQGTARMFGDGQFVTPSRKARFVSVKGGAIACAPTPDAPFVLNTGRVRDQWHTMTRTALSPRLMTHIAEPFVEVHPDDASKLGLEQGCIAEVSTPHGTSTLRVLVNRGQQPGSLFVPIHWSAENSSNGRIGALVAAVVDPISGQPEAKATPATVVAKPMAAYGFVLSRQAIKVAGADYWAKAQLTECHLVNFALEPRAIETVRLAAWARSILPNGERLEVEDNRLGLYRSAIMCDGRLEAIVFIGPTPKLPGHDWLQNQFGRELIPTPERRTLLAGRPVEGAADQGAIVCVCFQVGELRIGAVIKGGAKSVEAIGIKLGAGTNCGSCVPELKRLIAQSRPLDATAAE